jgi:hypothetical protein
MSAGWVMGCGSVDAPSFSRVLRVCYCIPFIFSRAASLLLYSSQSCVIFAEIDDHAHPHVPSAFIRLTPSRRWGLDGLADGPRFLPAYPHLGCSTAFVPIDPVEEPRTGGISRWGRAWRVRNLPTSHVLYGESAPNPLIIVRPVRTMLWCQTPARS